MYPLKNIKDLPILIVGGKTDRLVTPGDYKNMAAIL